MRHLVNLMHEIGMLAKTPRSGFAFLGTGRQSVAEHSFRVTAIGFLLADICKKKINREKLLLMCLFHDLPESRIGDLNYVNKRYVQADVNKVMETLQNTSVQGKHIVNYIHAYENEESLEAQLAHDADQLELLLVLKQEFDTGNHRAMEWFDLVAKRIETDEGKKLVDEIRETPSDAWWIENKGS